VHTNPHIASTGVLKTRVNPTDMHRVTRVLSVDILVPDVAVAPIAPLLYIRVNVTCLFTSELGNMLAH